MPLINGAILVEITCYFERKMPLGMFNSNGIYFLLQSTYTVQTYLMEEIIAFTQPLSDGYSGQVFLTTRAIICFT